MRNSCIVTDSSVIFTEADFPGMENLYIVPHRIQIGDVQVNDSTDIEQLGEAIKIKRYPRLMPITEETFREKFQQLAAQYQDVIVVLLSSQLNPSIGNAREAAAKMKSPAPIYIIDSQTTATGLGLLVQVAARASESDMSGVEIQRVVRGFIRHIYGIYCLPDLMSLHYSGVLDPAQAMVGEMLSLIPFFILESGRLIPVQKARSSRHMVDILQEFIAEFDYLKSINLIHGLPKFENECRNLKERISQYFPNIAFSEHRVGTALASILGPNCLGLVAVDEGISEFLA